MRLLETTQSLQQWRTESGMSTGVLGFVPTMGALHQGHISLLKKAKEQCAGVLVSIFINPTQFNNPDDLKKYPRILEKDLQLLENHDCDAVFVPSESAIYPTGLNVSQWDFGLLSNSLEAHYRPKHFDGVLTVVKRLFELVQPQLAFFGEKDFQQLCLIRAMTEFERLPVKIISCPTMREADGLAMSSRNLRLSAEERKVAGRISQVLGWAVSQKERIPPRELAGSALGLLSQTRGLRPEYFEIVDSETFEPLLAWDSSSPIALAAAYVGSVRLIDNMWL